MSEVAVSRPISVTDGVPKLPQIEHPMSRMLQRAQGLGIGGGGGGGRGGDGGGLELRGLSRATSRNSALHAPVGRPLAAEEATFQMSTLSGRRPSRLSLSRVSNLSQSAPQRLLSRCSQEPIPEGVSVVNGDPNKPRLPVFGVHSQVADAALERNRAASVASRMSLKDEHHRCHGTPPVSTRLETITQSRLEVDEIETVIREKMKGAYFEMRKRFVDNDPEQKGNISRDALLRILVGLISRPLSHSQLSRLFERLGIRHDKPIISFTEFFAAFNVLGADGPPRWMDPVQRGATDKVTMNSDQVHEQLQEKMRQRFVDMADMFPQVIEGGSGRLLKSEMRNALNKMLFVMEDSEFDKLWKKYDPGNVGSVDGMTMLKMMGIVMQKPAGKKNGKTKQQKEPGSVRTPKNKSETERARSLMIESWLKDKFRQGFHSMRAEFEAQDPGKLGVVPYETFLKVLKNFGLSLDKAYLNEFLARCAVDMHKDGAVPYRDFLHRFQDRSEAGMAHKILSDPYHSYNAEQCESSEKSPLGKLETQMMNMFQRDFLSLLGSFRKIDRYNIGVLSQEEFRAAFESKFQFQLTDEQYRQFVDRLPLNNEGYVKYSEFMKQFDTKGLAPSLFHQSEAAADEMEMLEEEDWFDSGVGDPNKRSVREMWYIIKNIFDYNFQTLEKHFYDIDTYNSGRLTQDQLYELLKRFPVTPEISRGEIRELWKQFFLRNKQALDYKEFCRAFIYNVNNSSFPNAKVVPPRKGDSDLMPRSKKLNGVSILLEDNLRSKVDYMWDALRAEFTAMDPYGTGFVTREEFQEVLKELSVCLSEFELADVTRKFCSSSDGRVSYVEFLKPFAAKRQTWRHGNNLLSLLQHPNTKIHGKSGSGPAGGIIGLLAKADLKSLQRAFKKLDSDGSGSLSMPEFRSVLKLGDVELSNEDCFNLMSQYDAGMTGRMPYNKILKDAGVDSKLKKVAK